MVHGTNYRVDLVAIFPGNCVALDHLKISVELFGHRLALRRAVNLDQVDRDLTCMPPNRERAVRDHGIDQFRYNQLGGGFGFFAPYGETRSNAFNDLVQGAAREEGRSQQRGQDQGLGRGFSRDAY